MIIHSIKTADELGRLKAESLVLTSLRDETQAKYLHPLLKSKVQETLIDSPYAHHILVCASTGCLASKALRLIEIFETRAKEAGMENIMAVKTGCFGLCASGPVVIVYPEGIFYELVDEAGAERIFAEHILGGKIVRDLVYHDAIVDDALIPYEESGFFKKQMRVALRNCGFINPENVHEYVAHDGYAALAQVLGEMTPADVIEKIKESGLRGRGGAGFSTGMKWSFAAATPPGQKYIVCNADEGDPGAFMDRSILEGDPHSVIEAMVIAGYAIGANLGYVYCRAEYPVAIKRLQIAIDQARALGMLGADIFGSGFDFDIRIKPGAGAFVCGEETALLRSIMGKRG
ncbi:MAG: NADH-quinone oxidoreductase subunit F, partial [Defluviitaleaceae bacterium]|nr:NADH-quinone oxidoreductase subunit F [Defluviitaleaceae bacterium]